MMKLMKNSNILTYTNDFFLPNLWLSIRNNVKKRDGISPKKPIKNISKESYLTSSMNGNMI